MEKSKLLELLEEASPTEMTLIHNFFVDKLLKELDDDKQTPVVSYLIGLVEELKAEIHRLEDKVTVLENFSSKDTGYVNGYSSTDTWTASPTYTTATTYTNACDSSTTATITNWLKA